MNRLFLCLITGCLVFSASTGSAAGNPLRKFFENKTTDETMPIIQSAEQMYKNMTDPAASDKNYVAIPENQYLQNPFQSRLPEKQADAPVPVTFQPERYVPDISEHKDTSAPTPQFTISGLVWNTDQPQAILNNRIVAIGDKVEGWTITGISQQGIVVTTLENKTYLIKP